MPPPADRSFAQTPFDDFLFASVASDRDGQFLTVISALARVDLDPWDEAARLSRLPRQRAIDEIAAIVTGQLAEGAPSSEPQSIAERLVELLPPPGRRPEGDGEPRTTDHREPRPDLRRRVTWLLIALTALAVFWALSGS